MARLNDASALGFLKTNTSIGDVLTMSPTAVDRATGIWHSYLNIDKGSIAVLPPASRLKEVAYFYALELAAVKLLMMRVGNVGADGNSAIGDVIMQKAGAVLEIVSERLQAFEKYCQMEASVVGTVEQSGSILSMFSAIDGTAETCKQIAWDFWNVTPHDEQLALEANLDDNTNAYVNNMAIGIGMQILAANMTQRKLGNLGARNQAAGDYYISAARAMAAEGTGIVNKQVTQLMTERPLHSVAALGL